MNDDELLSIGEFGRRARLTAKALRIYDQLGLLPPAITDEATGYRRYRSGQVRTGQLISVLRGADLSLADHDGPLEAILGCPATVQPDERTGVRTEPAHDEAYTTITKAQWDYPAILAAYDAVACSAAVAARPNSRLSCREVYHVEPDDIGPDDTICDVAYPLGDPQDVAAQVIE